MQNKNGYFAVLTKWHSGRHFFIGHAHTLRKFSVKKACPKWFFLFTLPMSLKAPGKVGIATLSCVWCLENKRKKKTSYKKQPFFEEIFDFDKSHLTD